MKKKSKKKTKNNFLRNATILFIILMIVLVFIKISNDTNQDKIQVDQRNSLFATINKNTTVSISKFSVYGTHLNIEGTMEIADVSGIKVTDAKLIMKSLEGEETIIDIEFNYSDNTLSFSNYDEINTGIDLESLTTTEYYMLLKVAYSNSDIKYYSFTNTSEYDDITYYTITKNNSNNKIDIEFSSYSDIPCLELKVSKVHILPEDVYDIAIDPGHGGLDAGATSGDYTEAELVLESGLELKEQLEKLGLKVFISRDEDSDKTADTAYNMYDDDGRINILNESNAKLIISLHLNSNEENVSEGGVEVYAPNNCNLDFAELLATNIVSYANTKYSALSTYKEMDGVYVRNFTYSDILAFKTKAQKGGYEEYNITTSTPYLYIIRETGGINTNAFVDGRNTTYGANKYYNSNVGIETYLIEMAYMIVKEDLNNYLNNSSKYVQGITESIKSYYNL